MKTIYIILAFSSCTLPFAKGEGAADYIGRDLAEVAEANRAPTFEEYKTKAMAGDDNAQFIVGMMYSQGKNGVEKNDVEALAFIALSDRNSGEGGGATAKSMISRLVEEMSPQQIEEAKKRLEQLVQQVK